MPRFLFVVSGIIQRQADMDRWQNLQDEIGLFTDKTFPVSTAKSKALHLAEEAREAAEDPSDILEWADCVILLLDGARKAGYTTGDLYHAVCRKMDINRKRTWQPPDDDGIARHAK